MERERLTRLLEDPARITRQDLADLVAMAERYPWFSGAQLLRAAGERLGGEVLSDDTLRVAGAHLPSRAVLFDLTKNPGARPAPMRVVHTDAATVEEEVAQAVEEDRRKKDQDPVVEVQQIPSGIPVEPDIPRSHPVQGIEQVPVPVDTPAPLAELDLQILQNAASNAYDLTLLEQLPAAPAPSSAPVIAPPVEAEELPIVVDSNARLRFTEWLDSSRRSAPSEASAPQVSQSQPSAAPEQLDTIALIDRFMRHETPEPKKTAFFTPQVAGKRSLDDTAGLVTETLARIYTAQGNTAKAMDAYRRLAVKYPEKSAYFAALSKALEEQQNP